MRQGLSRWCKDHTTRGLRYGHADAGPLRPKQWAAERRAVLELLEANADHPGLQQVLSVLSSWSAKARSNEDAFKGADEIARLARHGITSLDILSEVCACWTWLQQNPHALPVGSDRAADFAISRAVFQLAPRPRRQTRGPGGYWPVTVKAPANRSYSPKARPSALAYVGGHLRAILAPFLANVAHSLETREEQHEAQQAALRAPLRAPVRL